MRQIQVFMAAANAGSFTKAGDKLFMTQPMVSKSIATMEKSLGMNLFVRKPHGISLTPGGRVLYQSWKGLMRNMEQTVATAHAAQGGTMQQVLISDFSTSVKKEYLWPQVSRFRELHPEAELLLETVAPGRCLERLETNNCDVAFAPFCETPLFEQHGMLWRHVLKCPQCVWVHRTNPLYERDVIEVCDLADQTFIIVSPLILTYYEKMVFDICRHAGFEPRDIIRVADVGAATLNLKLGRGVVIRDSVFDSAETSDIRLFDLAGTQGGTIMAWQKNLDNPSALDFIALYE